MRSGPWWNRLRTTVDVVHRRVERDHRIALAQFRRRQAIAAVVLVVGSVALAASLRMDADSPWFPAAALGVAAIWGLGATATGPLHLGRIDLAHASERPVVQPILIGLALGLVFIVGALVLSRMPGPLGEVRSVLSFAQSGSLVLLTVTTALSGVAEEMFFRGGLYAAVPDPHQIWVTTGLYTVATVLTGNLMLALAAVAVGLVTGLERRATGGWLAPALTHVTWSMCMLHVLPHVV